MVTQINLKYEQLGMVAASIQILCLVQLAVQYVVVRPLHLYLVTDTFSNTKSLRYTLNRFEHCQRKSLPISVPQQIVIDDIDSIKNTEGRSLVACVDGSVEPFQRRDNTTEIYKTQKRHQPMPSSHFTTDETKIDILNQLNQINQKRNAGAMWRRFEP